MAYQLIFNPISGQFDFVGSSTPSGGPASRYIKNFLVADWQINGPDYSISVPQSEHGLSNNPVVHIYETNGSDYELVQTSILFNNSGDVTLKVNNTSRFNGLVIIL